MMMREEVKRWLGRIPWAPVFVNCSYLVYIVGWYNPLPIGQAKGAASGESELHLGHARIIVFPVAGPARGHSS